MEERDRSRDRKTEKLREKDEVSKMKVRRMRGQCKRAVSAVLALILISGFSGFAAGCSDGGKGDAMTPEKDVILKFLMFGDKPQRMEEVLDEFYRRAGKDLHIRLEMDWVEEMKYKTTKELAMNAKLDYDLVFDAAWHNLKERQALDWYADLEGYFMNPDYPGLEKAFSEQVLENNRINGKILAAPVFRTYGSGIASVHFRQDWATEFGIGEITGLEELEQYLQMILERKPGVIPLVLQGKRGFYNLSPYIIGYPEEDRDRILTIGSGIAGMDVMVYLDEGRGSVQAYALAGDPDEAFAGFPEGLRFDFPAYRLSGYRAWRKYCAEDSINETKQDSVFTSGLGGALIGTLDDYEKLLIGLKETEPEAELGEYIISKPVRNREKRAISTGYTANNYICVPAWSQHIEETMTFLDWLNRNQENHDLFELGIEGIHWEEVSPDQYRVLGEETGEAYLFPGYAMTWNPNYIRFQEGIPEDILEYKRYECRESTFYKGRMNDFVFDAAGLDMETVRCRQLMDRTWEQLKHGMIPNPREVFEETVRQCREAGADRIVEEVIRQVNEYLRETE